MVLSHIVPDWFYGVDMILEICFAVITLIVVIFSYKLYQQTDQRLIKYFGISFLLISISYIIQSTLNFLIYSKLNENVCRIIKIQSIANFEYFGILTHMLFMTIGIAILFYTTLKDTRIRLLWFLIIIALSSVFLSTNNLYMFYMVSTIYLSFISYHFILNYLKNKKTKTLLVALAFIFLLFGNFHFLISVNHSLFYAIGHILEFFAYLFILTNLYLVWKK